AMRTDPENRLLGHMNRKRIDFESLRDGLLAVAGKLDPTVYGRSVDLFARPYTGRRSIYGYIDRQNLPGPFRAFDFANPDLHSPQRPVTTVPQQALFLMNSPFVVEQAKAIAARKEIAWPIGREERTKRIYRVVLGRNPTASEMEVSVEFTAAVGQSKREAGQAEAWELLAQALLLSNEFAFVD